MSLIFEFIHSVPIFTNRLNTIHIRKYYTSSFCAYFYYFRNISSIC